MMQTMSSNDDYDDDLSLDGPNKGNSQYRKLKRAADAEGEREPSKRSCKPTQHFGNLSPSGQPFDFEKKTVKRGSSTPSKSSTPSTTATPSKSIITPSKSITTSKITTPSRKFESPLNNKTPRSKSLTPKSSAIGPFIIEDGDDDDNDDDDDDGSDSFVSGFDHNDSPATPIDRPSQEATSSAGSRGTDHTNLDEGYDSPTFSSDEETNETAKPKSKQLAAVRPSNAPTPTSSLATSRLSATLTSQSSSKASRSLLPSLSEMSSTSSSTTTSSSPASAAFSEKPPFSAATLSAPSTSTSTTTTVRTTTTSSSLPPSPKAAKLPLTRSSSESMDVTSTVTAGSSSTSQWDSLSAPSHSTSEPAASTISTMPTPSHSDTSVSSIPGGLSSIHELSTRFLELTKDLYNRSKPAPWIGTSYAGLVAQLHEIVKRITGGSGIVPQDDVSGGKDPEDEGLYDRYRTLRNKFNELQPLLDALAKTAVQTSITAKELSSGVHDLLRVV